MARFTTRVELHGADGEAYETLHEEMESRGFTRFIEDEKGHKYQLPTAEYNLDAAATTEQVRDLAVQAAIRACALHNLNKEPWVLVTKADGSRRWSGLKRVP